MKSKTIIIAGLSVLLILVACWFGFHSKQNDSNAKLTSISQLNSPEYKIGVPQGAGAMTAIERAFPDATIIYYNTYEDGYLAVQKGMIDAFAYDKAMMTFAAAYLKGVEVLDEVVDSIDIVVGISPKRPDLVDDINAFIAATKADGTYDDMYDRWVNQASNVLPDIKPPAHPTMALKAGTSGRVVPMNYYDQNLELTGFDVEFMKRLAVYLNADLEISTLNFDGMIASLETGTADIVVSDLNATEERREKIIMSDPIRSSDTVFMVKQGRFITGKNQQITDISQLAGKKVGIVTGTVFDSVLAEHLPEAIPEYFNSLADEVAALQTGRIYAILMDEPVARDLVNNTAGITYLEDNLTEQSYAFAFNLNNTGLQKKFNQVLADLYAEGIIAEIDAKWFGKDESAKVLPDIKLTGENGTIVYGTDCSIGAPFDYVKDQKIVGYEVELMMHICDRLGYDLEIVDMSFGALIPALASGKH
jgi:polar amino acid transport system substrate-binding protein